MSAWPSVADNSGQGTAVPSIESASAAAWASVRLVMSIRPAPCAFKCCAVSFPISPAPTTTTVRPVRSPKIFLASEVAAKLIDTAPSDSAVSVRTRLPTVNDQGNTLFSTGPTVRSSVAAANASFTCPRIWGSPTTSESRPPATRNR